MPTPIRGENYFHFPSPGETGDPERYRWLTSQIIVQLFLNPHLSFSRRCWADMLWEMYHSSEPAEAGYTEMDRLMSMAFLQGWLTTFGLLTGNEVRRIQEGVRTENIDPAHKYVTWKEAVRLAQNWKISGETVGLIHGTFDPPHIGHSRLAAQLWTHSQRVLVGFDNDPLTKKRKGKNRPRFPLAARMWEMASLPTVDGVFVLPFTSEDSTAFANMYMDLHISFLGAGGNNPLIDEYRRRMTETGGRLLVLDEETWSSTKLLKDAGNTKTERLHHISRRQLKASMDKTAQVAIAAGYLADLLP